MPRAPWDRKPRINQTKPDDKAVAKKTVKAATKAAKKGKKK